VFMTGGPRTRQCHRRPAVYEPPRLWECLSKIDFFINQENESAGLILVFGGYV